MANLTGARVRSNMEELLPLSFDEATLVAGQNDILAAYAAFDAGTQTREQARPAAREERKLARPESPPARGEELFGRACPSCGGIGHVAVLPGKDSLQPLATASGLVRSAASARAEVLSAAWGRSIDACKMALSRARNAVTPPP